jgi:hypothetical protein
MYLLRPSDLSGKPFSTSAMEDHLTGTVIGCTSESEEEIEYEYNITI